MNPRLILPLAGFLLLAPWFSLRGATLHVSPAGADTNPDTAGRPLATLAKAQAAARRVAGKEPVTVVLHGGTFYLNAAHGDFRVKASSPALKLGFVNFPMDRFGVQKPTLKAIARTPVMPQATSTPHL